MSNLGPYRLELVLSTRLMTFADFESACRKQAEAEARLATALQEAIPQEKPTLRRFIKEQGVIEQLLRYGKYSDRYYYNLAGMSSYKQVVVAIEILRSVWKDNVVIMLDEPGERGVVSIRYFVAPRIY